MAKNQRDLVIKNPTSRSLLYKRLQSEKAMLQIVAPKVGGVKSKGGEWIAADHALEGAPSAVFDAVVLAPSQKGAQELIQLAAAVDWLRMAYAHRKVIGYLPDVEPLFQAAQIPTEEYAGIDSCAGGKFSEFCEAAKGHRTWDWEPNVRQ